MTYFSEEFRLTKRGVEYAKKVKNQDETQSIQWEWFCSSLEITHQTRDPQGGNWGRILALIDNDDQRKEYIMPMSMLAGEGSLYREELFSLGLRLGAGKNAMLHRYITMASPQARATCVLKCGWHDGCFVTPIKVYGQRSEERLVLQNQSVSKGYKIQGHLEEWKQEIGRFCVGNHRLLFVVCVALTGPCLNLLNEENFGFHMEGGSSIGKTTLLHIAASVWGMPIHGWRTTDNATEGLASQSNDSLLILDELSQVNGCAADAMTYMLGNGAGKARSRRDGSSKPIERFRLVFLSSGETGLASKMSEQGRQSKAGQTVRFIEIPADAEQGHGIFDCLHDFKDGNSLSIHLKNASERYTGVVADAFLEKLGSNRDEITIRLKDVLSVWMNTHCHQEYDGQVMRVCQKFGLVAAVGEYAIDVGILTASPGDATQASLTMFNAWIQRRGGTKADEFRQVEQKLRLYITEYGHSRFEPFNDDELAENTMRVNQRAGFKKKTSQGNWEYFMFKEIFEREIIGSLNKKSAIKHLIQCGLIVQDLQGKSTTSIRIPMHGQMRLYRIYEGLLGGDRGDVQA